MVVPRLIRSESQRRVARGRVPGVVAHDQHICRKRILCARRSVGALTVRPHCCVTGPYSGTGKRGRGCCNTASVSSPLYAPFSLCWYFLFHLPSPFVRLRPS